MEDNNQKNNTNNQILTPAESTPAEENAKNIEPNNQPPAELGNLKSAIANLKSGMTVKVHETIKDIDAKGKERTRIQIFEGMVLAVKKPKSPSGAILVRKISDNNIGVEKIFPLHSPLVKKIEVVKQIKARRSKLYYLRNYKKRLRSRNIE